MVLTMYQVILVLRFRKCFDAAIAGDLKALWIIGEDVVQTDPNTK